MEREDVTHLLTTVNCSTFSRSASTISVQDVERDPAAFLRRVEAGESFVVVSGERPLAEVRAVFTPSAQPRPFGLSAGRFAIPADFDAPLPDDVLDDFEGS